MRVTHENNSARIDTREGLEWGVHIVSAPTLLGAFPTEIILEDLLQIHHAIADCLKPPLPSVIVYPRSWTRGVLERVVIFSSSTTRSS